MHILASGAELVLTCPSGVAAPEERHMNRFPIVAIFDPWKPHCTAVYRIEGGVINVWLKGLASLL